jgi:hypothetical protein
MLAGAILVMGHAGCETIGQDINDAILSINPMKPREAATKMMDPYDADNRRLGTTLISNAPFGGVDTYVRAYRDMVLNERDPIVLATAVRALGRHGDVEDALRIAPHLAHENVQVRWEAAKALQRLHNPVVISDLLRVLRDEAERTDVRVAAAVALGQYPEDRVFQGLVGALDARELALNAAAGESLETLTGQSLGLDAPDWLAWYNANLSTAFASKGEYLYPTYQREETFWERVAFWTSRNFEHPGLPAGLRPKTQQDTYGDEQEGPSSAPSQ